MCYLELSEDKSLAIGQNAEDGTAIAAEDDQTTFDVKYLGNTPVDSTASAIAEAVKTILVMVRKLPTKLVFILYPKRYSQRSYYVWYLCSYV